MISTYISTWFIVCSNCLYFVRRFGAAFVEFQQSLDDAAVQYSTFGSTIIFVQYLCNNTFNVKKSHLEQIGYLYDIGF